MKHNDNISTKSESSSNNLSLTQWRQAQQIFRETLGVLAWADHIICELICGLCLTLFNWPCWLFSVSTFSNTTHIMLYTNKDFKTLLSRLCSGNKTTTVSALGFISPLVRRWRRKVCWVLTLTSRWVWKTHPLSTKLVKLHRRILKIVFSMWNASFVYKG